jgi:hypothetical protein
VNHQTVSETVAISNTAVAGAMQSISLLWPPGKVRSAQELAPRLDAFGVNDLDLETVATAFAARREHRQLITKILLHLCDDPEVIRYRQDVLEDLSRYPTLAQGLKELLPQINALGVNYYAKENDFTGLYEVSWRLGELENYVDCVGQIGAIFDEIDGDLASAGLRQLRDSVATISQDPTFVRFVQELPDLLANIRSIASITIGVNLDFLLRPVEAALLSVNSKKFTAPSLLNKLLGGEKDEWEGLAPLHSIKRDSDLYGPAVDPMMTPLFRDLAEVSRQASRPVARALKRYTHLNSHFLSNLGEELAFYLGAVGLMQRIRAAGLPLCRPEIAPRDERVCEVKENYNIALALDLLAREGRTHLDADVIANDVAFGPQRRIVILTGPNRGGKTTYTKAIGLTQVLAQAGLFVPGKRARISPVDGIFTHFPIEERLEEGTGRLGDEAKRLHSIFSRATRHSLVLFNESLSSTSAGEGVYLAQDVVRILQLMGARAIFATHLHELAARTDELNAESPNGAVVSMVASLVEETTPGDTDVKRSYKVILSPPMGHSCARQIASLYGISYEQLRDLLRERQVA